MSSSSSLSPSMEQSLSNILDDLPNVKKEKVFNSIKNVGIINAARILGYDLSHYDNLVAAGRLLMFDLQQNVPETISEYAELLKHRLNHHTYKFMQENKDRIQVILDKYKNNDYNYDFFSGYTMIKTYLAKPYYGEEVCETPQYLFMRIAIQLYYDEGIERVLEVFSEMSDHYYTPASPTIFNSGFNRPSLSSCFLSTISDDLESILYTGVGDQGMISRAKGGIGMDISRIRHSEIGLVGKSKGIVPFVRVYNEMVRAVDQLSMRKGAATLYLRPHHIDVFEFCDLVLKVGDKNERAHDINTALWCPWIFWDRIRAKGKWTLFCPAKTPQLNDIWGDEFSRMYVELEELAEKREKEFQAALKKKEELDKLVSDGTINRRDTMYKQVMDVYRVANRQRIDHKVVPVLDLYNHIITTQRKAGMPYILHADAVNMKCNQKNLGYIRCSNLCLEITEYSSDDEVASCNLSSISLRRFVKGKINRPSKDHISPLQNINFTGAYDFDMLGHMTKSVTFNLNKVIDHNWYPLDKIENGVLKPGKIRRSNMRHRPIGLGVSGFAEALHGVDLAFEDPLTVIFNKMIFGCIYFNALSASVILAVRDGKYETFEGSPFSKGKLQFDLWKEEFSFLASKNRINPKVRTKADDEPVEPSQWGQKEVLILARDGDTVVDIIQPNWDDMKRVVMKYGTRNSLLTALMPTATTSQILRNAETVEAHMSNIYSRKVMNGAYPVVNRFMITDLEELNLWNAKMLSLIQADGGSVSKIAKYVKDHLSEFPSFEPKELNWDRLAYVQKKYKTMWELPQKLFMHLAADRGRYQDQSQSTNIFISDPQNQQLNALHLYSDFLGLKTGMYYLRQLPAIEPIKFTCTDRKLLNYVKTLDIKIEEDEVEEKGKEGEEVEGEKRKEVEEKERGIGKRKEEKEKEVCRILKQNGVVCLSCE